MNRTFGFVALALVALGMAGAASAQSVRIELTQGTKARYRVAERLVGINFSNEAVGDTTAVTGAIVLKADGSVDAAQSKITIDMKSLSSDQTLRDMFLQMSVLQTAKFPTLEFVPTGITGLPWPLPNGTKMANSPMILPTPAGFQLTGNLTLHGQTKPVTWSVITTIDPNAINGRGTAKITFADFGMTKPQVPVLASAEDTIQLELDFRAKRIAQ